MNFLILWHSELLFSIPNLRHQNRDFILWLEDDHSVRIRKPRVFQQLNQLRINRLQYGRNGCRCLCRRLVGQCRAERAPGNESITDQDGARHASRKCPSLPPWSP